MKESYYIITAFDVVSVMGDKVALDFATELNRKNEWVKGLKREVDLTNFISVIEAFLERVNKKAFPMSSFFISCFPWGDTENSKFWVDFSLGGKMCREVKLGNTSLKQFANDCINLPDSLNKDAFYIGMDIVDKFKKKES